MKTCTIKEWNGTDQAWLWVETGDGQLLPIKSVRADCWIVTGTGWCTSSWCCHWGTIVYLGHAEDAKVEEKLLQEKLRERRIRWAERERATLASIGID